MTELDGLTLFCAFRYALGRRTYVPGHVAEKMRENLDLFGLNQLRQIISEIEQCIVDDMAGDPNIDVPTWVGVVKTIEIELEKRQKESD